jgi:dihydroorotate dehydrogenase (NAD+) catalytic subunit
MNRLEVNAGGIIMKNPVATASGTCGYGDVYTSSYCPSELGAVVVKGVSLLPRTGNPSPRMAESPCGMINSIGLENIGLKAFMDDKLPWLREKGATVVVNIFGESPEDYAALATELDGAPGVAGLELNISCPNVKAGGITFGSDPAVASQLVSLVRKNTGLPLWVKLSPVADIKAMSRAVEEAGASAISLINTIPAMAIDAERRRPVLAAGTGGLSGPAIKPVALRMVYDAARAVKVPVIGMGGISCGSDAVEFMLAGAAAVQVGTANFTDPATPLRIIRGIEDYLDRHGLQNAARLCGALEG